MNFSFEDEIHRAVKRAKRSAIGIWIFLPISALFLADESRVLSMLFFAFFIMAALSLHSATLTISTLTALSSLPNNSVNGEKL